MDDNTPNEPYPFNTADTATTIISLPADSNADDEIVHLFRQTSSDLYFGHNPPAVSHQMAESYPPTRPRHHHFQSPLGAAPMLPVPTTQGSAGIPLQPPYGQGHPSLGTGQVRAAGDRLPSQSPRQSPEGPLLPPQRRGRQRRGSEEDSPLPRNTRQRDTARLTNDFLAWNNTYWPK